ncbi:hypothetical protein ASPBRDRAFT_199637 [Aspergillus brasiliensis CBS 101740]|uniref:Uncharacterized protein n=1 Tax=Aspergillus brasiliensis (strain CBS 101740 / IMI 381727 / IBT 21946) TaxID=767769 RepID=A0A1L9U8D9_ASPBC|nr:hypothetical protein ASPBRDRAFT_199637 [Aspergillus brasiliensis CBS 101740]
MCPPEELSSLSPDSLRLPICLVSEDKVDELRLSDDGDAGTDEFGVVPCDDAMELLNAAAAAAGWHTRPDGAAWSQDREAAVKTAPRPPEEMQNVPVGRVNTSDSFEERLRAPVEPFLHS